jgi:hypothetical protein
MPSKKTPLVGLTGLFAGVGGLDLGLASGLARSGFQVEHKAFVENAEFPQEVLAARFPAVRIYDDVKKCSFAIPDQTTYSVLSGGFPCQDVSAANKDAKGLAGPRSGLWSEQARLIAEALPRFAVVENVAALRSNGLWKVLRDLHDIGYVAQYDTLKAYDVGAPFQRRRIFIIAQHRDNYSLIGRFEPFAAPPPAWQTPWPAPWVDKPSARQLAAIKALGNAVVPAVADRVGFTIGQLIKGHGDRPSLSHGGFALRAASDMPSAGWMGPDGRLRPLKSVSSTGLPPAQCFTELELRGNRQDRERELAARIAARRLPTPTATDWKGGGVGGAWYRNLKQGMGGIPSPTFLEWVMGFPPGWTAV